MEKIEAAITVILNYVFRFSVALAFATIIIVILSALGLEEDFPKGVWFGISMWVALGYLKKFKLDLK